MCSSDLYRPQIKLTESNSSNSFIIDSSNCDPEGVRNTFVLAFVDVVDNFKIEFIGSTDLLPDFLQETINQLKEVRGGGQKTLTIALGYGGRQEILDAIKGLIDQNRKDHNDFDELIENVTDEQLRKHLYSPETPDIDLIIRTSGESRLSGFLLWQSAYSEVIFQDVYWPEFRKIDFLRCLREYSQRERRFGK